MRVMSARMRAIALVLAVSAVLASSARAYSQPAMVPSSLTAAVLRAQEVMIGYGGGEMRWSNTITRAEAVKLLLAAIGEVTPSLTRSPLAFVDVPRSHWAFSHITMAAEMGLVQGRPGNVFDPEQGVTMAEFMVMVTRVYVGLGSEAGHAVEGIRLEPLWAVPELAGWSDLIELVGGGASVIDLDYPASRGEVGTLAGRMMERLGLAYDLAGTVEKYTSAAREISVRVQEAASPVSLEVSGDVSWFSRSGITVDGAALVGQKVQIVIDAAGRAAVIAAVPQ